MVLLAFQSSIVGINISVPTGSKDALVEVAHLVAVVGLVILSSREHYRSVSPSTSLVVYLSTRTFLNISTLLLVHEGGFIGTRVLQTTIEAGCLIVESQNKRAFLLEPFTDIAPEETAGPWSNASFAWVASMLFTGKDITLSLEALPQNPYRFDPSNFRQKILLAWDQRGKLSECIECIKLTDPKAKPESRFTLPLILVHCLMPDFATVAITRFMLIVLRYAQPLLISKILQLLAANALGGQPYELSCTIVIISTVVYIGQAVSKPSLVIAYFS